MVDRIIYSFVLIFACFICCSFCADVRILIDSTQNDCQTHANAFPLTKPLCSPNNLPDALALIASLASQDYPNVWHIDVVLRGHHELKQPIVLNETHTAENLHVHVRGMTMGDEGIDDEPSTVSGGVVVVGWEEVPDKAGLWVAPFNDTRALRQLWVNGIRANRTHISPEWVFGLQGTHNATASGYFLTGGQPGPMFPVYNTEYVEVRYAQAWHECLCLMDSIVGGTNITMQQPCWDRIYTGEAMECKPEVIVDIVNVFEALGSQNNTAGTFYHDPTALKLYYFPNPWDNLLEAGTVVAPIQTELVNVSGIYNYTFSNITFEYATWREPSTGAGWIAFFCGYHTPPEGPVGEFNTPMPAALTCFNCTNVSFDGITIRHVGQTGIMIYGGSHNTSFRGGLVFDTSGNGIHIGNNDNNATDTPLERQDYLLEVSDNFINHPGQEYPGGVGIYGGFLRNASVIHNSISWCPYSAMVIGWGWPGWPNSSPLSWAQDNLFAYNEVNNYMLTLSDGGGIYFAGWTPNTLMLQNWVHHDIPFPGGACGVYTDQGSAAVSVVQNVFQGFPVTSPQVWFYNWAPGTHDIHAVGNYADGSMMFLAGSQSSIVNTTVVLRNPWPEFAQNVMNNAGPRTGRKNTNE